MINALEIYTIKEVAKLLKITSISQTIYYKPSFFGVCFSCIIEVHNLRFARETIIITLPLEDSIQ